MFPALDFLVCDSSHKLILEAVAKAPDSLLQSLRLVMFTWPSPEQEGCQEDRTGIRSGTGEWRLLSGAEKPGGYTACDVPLRCPHIFLQRPIRQRRLVIAMQEGLPVPPGMSADTEGGARQNLSAEVEAAAASDGRGGGQNPVGPTGKGAAAGAAAPPTRELRLLVAEDNTINMKVCLRVLKRLGQSNVVTCQDGQFALEELCKRGGPKSFDLILTDLHMPRMGGMDLLSAMQKRWSGPEHSCVPVVAVTADAFEETQQRCLAAGFSRCLAKPFRVEEISKLLQKLGVGPTRPASQ
jgi:CheY-like chemotaxis protein